MSRKLRNSEEGIEKLLVELEKKQQEGKIDKNSQSDIVQHRNKIMSVEICISPIFTYFNKSEVYTMHDDEYELVVDTQYARNSSGYSLELELFQDLNIDAVAKYKVWSSTREKIYYNLVKTNAPKFLLDNWVIFSERSENLFHTSLTNPYQKECMFGLGFVRRGKHRLQIEATYNESFKLHSVVFSRT